MANYDVTIRTDDGAEITFYGSKTGDNGEHHMFGYSQIDGLGDPGRRTTTTTKSGADGGLTVAEDQLYSTRIISFDGFTMCESVADKRNALDFIRRSLPIRERVLVLIAAPTGEVYGARAVVQTCTPTIAYTRLPRFLLDISVDLVCDDPYFQDYTGEANNVIINKTTPGGLVWAESSLDWLEDHLSWSDGASNPVVNNTGVETVYPLLVITGQTTNPIITNLTTGESSAIPMALTEDDVLEIDMDDETIKLNGSNISLPDVRSTMWGLVPGINQLQYVSTSLTDSAVVTLSWRNRSIEAF